MSKSKFRSEYVEIEIDNSKNVLNSLLYFM